MKKGGPSILIAYIGYPFQKDVSIVCARFHGSAPLPIEKYRGLVPSRRRYRLVALSNDKEDEVGGRFEVVAKFFRNRANLSSPGHQI